MGKPGSSPGRVGMLGIPGSGNGKPLIPAELGGCDKIGGTCDVGDSGPTGELPIGIAGGGAKGTPLGSKWDSGGGTGGAGGPEEVLPSLPGGCREV